MDTAVALVEACLRREWLLQRVRNISHFIRTNLAIPQGSGTRVPAVQSKSTLALRSPFPPHPALVGFTCPPSPSHGGYETWQIRQLLPPTLPQL
jgi:hypothetical protein